MSHLTMKPGSGIDSLTVLRQNVAIARNFTPMTAEEMAALRKRCADHFELYKSTKFYDVDVGRKQHNFPTKDELPH